MSFRATARFFESSTENGLVLGGDEARLENEGFPSRASNLVGHDLERRERPLPSRQTVDRLLQRRGSRAGQKRANLRPQIERPRGNAMDQQQPVVGRREVLGHGRDIAIAS